MSFLLYARPAPVDQPEPVIFGQLKHVIARRLWDHDGSLRSDVVRIDGRFIEFLRGVEATSKSTVLGDQATELIQIIEDNPQGVDLWIGEREDH